MTTLPVTAWKMGDCYDVWSIVMVTLCWFFQAAEGRRLAKLYHARERGSVTSIAGIDRNDSESLVP